MQTPAHGAPSQDLEHLRLVEELEALRAEVRELHVRLAEAERLADHDVLTPLLNRRAFMREVQRAIALARRYKTPASVVFLDLDGFKGVNDRYGHKAGDATLVAVSERILGAVRDTDLVGRIGGDEFAVLLQHADGVSAAGKAEALQSVISASPIFCDGAVFQVGVTYGVREIAAADTAEQALAEADAVMYLRKPAKT